MIDISPKHVLSKKVVGKLNGKPVMEVKTTGGYNLVVTMKGGSVEVLGVGPHRAISRYIAERKEPDLEWTELSKSEYVDPESFMAMVPKYEELTDQFRSI